MTGDQLEPAGSQEHRAGTFSNIVPVLDTLSNSCFTSFGPPAVTGAQFDPSGGQEVWARIAESSSSSSTTGQKVQVSSFRQADADSVKHVPSQSSPPAVTGDQLDPAGSQDHRACISSNAVPVLDHLSDFCTPSFGPPAVTGAQFDPSGGQEVRARIAASSSSRSTIGQQVQAASFRQADADSVIATRQFLVYFQARDALGKSQRYLGSSVRPEDTKDLQIGQGNR